MGNAASRGLLEVRLRLIIALLLVGAAVAGCAQIRGHGDAGGRAEAVMAARQCGRTLGIAARCNLVRDDHDYGIVRYAVLQGLSDRYGAVSSDDELAEALDLAALDRITSISACRMPSADLQRVERAVRSGVSRCTQP